MITRKIDTADPRVGFVTDWVNGLAQHLDRLIVITWQPSVGTGLAPNVELVELPKSKLLRCVVLPLLVFKKIRTANGIFCHMNPEYTLLAGPSARLRGKKVVSWYTHGTVSWRARVMEKIATTILTASHESFRINSKKVVVTGHGIDIEQFSPPTDNQPANRSGLITVGRLSPTKDYETMIKALTYVPTELVAQASLTIVGVAGLATQRSYVDSLHQMVGVMKLDHVVQFAGAVTHTALPDVLGRKEIFINLSQTGSLDKAVLEAMACGCIVVTSNVAFQRIIPPELMVQGNDPKQLAAKLTWLIRLDQTRKQQLSEQLRKEVVDHHNLAHLTALIVEQFSTISAQP